MTPRRPGMPTRNGHPANAPPRRVTFWAALGLDHVHARAADLFPTEETPHRELARRQRRLIRRHPTLQRPRPRQGPLLRPPDGGGEFGLVEMLQLPRCPHVEKFAAPHH